MPAVKNEWTLIIMFYFKVIVGSFNSSNLWSNFTLDSEVTSLQLDNLTSDEIYWVKIAAYNRKGKVTRNC